MLLKMKVF